MANLPSEPEFEQAFKGKQCQQRAISLLTSPPTNTTCTQSLPARLKTAPSSSNTQNTALP